MTKIQTLAIYLLSLITAIIFKYYIKKMLISNPSLS